jgi:hypothetical protein
MHRRRFIALIGSAIALPCVAAAQQKTMPVIGILGLASPVSFAPFLASFRQGLARAAKHATSMIPIVFIAGDPVGEGLVTSTVFLK